MCYPVAQLAPAPASNTFPGTYCKHIQSTSKFKLLPQGMASVTWKQAMLSRITTPRKSTIILSLDDGTKSGKRKTRHLLSKCAVSLTKYLALRPSSVSPWLSPFSSMELKDVLLKINLQWAYPGSCWKFYLSDVIKLWSCIAAGTGFWMVFFLQVPKSQPGQGNGCLV